MGEALLSPGHLLSPGGNNFKNTTCMANIFVRK
jgi:hypothetical protein